MAELIWQILFWYILGILYWLLLSQLIDDTGDAREYGERSGSFMMIGGQLAKLFIGDVISQQQPNLWCHSNFAA